VLPKYVNNDNHLFSVDNEFNGVIVDGAFSGEQFLKGRGAGGHPTGAAVLSDISALSYGYKYEYKKQKQNPDIKFTNNVTLKVYLRYHNDEDLKQLQFESIVEQYTGGNYHYVVGSIKLQNLIVNKAYILKNKLFVAAIGDDVKLISEGKKKNTLELTVNLEN
jgi:homoserine dehydrogenase